MNNERKYWSGTFLKSLEPNQIFVFGSNPQARHFAGAAKSALSFGAKPIRRKGGEVIEEGIARGISGQTYALITKNLEIGYTEKSTGLTYEKEGFASVSPEQIQDNIRDMYDYAFQNPDKEFLITYKYDVWPNTNKPKKSLNGYDAEDMIAMFVDNQDLPNNIVFHDSYKESLERRIAMTNSAKVKRESMSNIKNAYTEAQDNGTIKTTTLNYSNTEDVYQKALFSKNLKFTNFFSAFDVFSQWHPSKFEHKGFQFFSAEQFMMFSKAKLFKDDNVAEKIMALNELTFAKDFMSGKLTKSDVLSSKKPAKEYIDEFLNKGLFYQSQDLSKINKMNQLWSALQRKTKGLGKEVSNFNEPLWVTKREGIILAGSNLKYSQNPDMKEKLMNTKGTILVEASPYDEIYGVKLAKNHPDIGNPSKWKGLNLLGKALTNLRYTYTPKSKIKNNRQKP